MQKIKKYFATRSIKKVLSNQKRNSYYIDFKSIKSILILFEADSEDQNFFIKDCIATLSEQGKKVSAWGYFDQKEISTPVFPHYRLFANKELSFLGIPNPALTKELQANEYDLVIELSTKDILPLDYLLAAAISPLKISKKKLYKGISDLMIDITETSDARFLFEQILFYLNKIKTKQ
jgi:hypothetical protein